MLFLCHCHQIMTFLKIIFFISRVNTSWKGSHLISLNDRNLIPRARTWHLCEVEAPWRRFFHYDTLLACHSAPFQRDLSPSLWGSESRTKNHLKQYPMAIFVCVAGIRGFDVNNPTGFIQKQPPFKTSNDVVKSSDLTQLEVFDLRKIINFENLSSWRDKGPMFLK